MSSENGEHEDLKKLSLLYENYGRDSLYPEALNHVNFALEKNPDVYMIEQLMEYTLQNYGYEYVEDFLTGNISLTDDNEVGPTGSNCAVKGGLQEIKYYLDMVERIGGQQLIDKVIVRGEPIKYISVVTWR